MEETPMDPQVFTKTILTNLIQKLLTPTASLAFWYYNGRATSTS